MQTALGGKYGIIGVVGVAKLDVKISNTSRHDDEREKYRPWSTIKMEMKLTRSVTTYSR
jgi:hypothetical protein